MVLRRALTLPDVEVVAINDLAHIGDLAYLLKYDSVHGLFPGEVAHDDHAMLVGARPYSSRQSKSLPKSPGRGLVWRW
jgi:glyceraldehyde 3-phosphate dehydrogenase